MHAWTAMENEQATRTIFYTPSNHLSIKMILQDVAESPACLGRGPPFHTRKRAPRHHQPQGGGSGGGRGKWNGR